MNYTVSTVKYQANDTAVMKGIYKLRKEVFVDRLNWKVSNRNGMEYDVFDNKATTYIFVKKGDTVVSSCRLIPTTSETMINTIFSGLLRGEEAVYRHDVVEISRLASVSAQNAGVGVLPSILNELRAFAAKHSIYEYVFVTTVAIERMLHRNGVKTSRFGDGKATNIDGARSVALRLMPEDLPRIH